jgi:hypothetical protein
MIGAASPLGEEAAPPNAPSSRPPVPPSPALNVVDEPVNIPTTGWPPLLVGFMVVGSLLLVAVIGFFVFR